MIGCTGRTRGPHAPAVIASSTASVGVHFISLRSGRS
jgi:hypothetical protein